MDAHLSKTEVIRKVPVLHVAPVALRQVKERVIEFILFLTAFTSVVITTGIVGVLVYESVSFFRHVSLWDFLTDTQCVSSPVKETCLEENFWFQVGPDRWRAAGPPTTHGAALRYHAATMLR